MRYPGRRPARSPRGVYYFVEARPRGDVSFAPDAAPADFAANPRQLLAGLMGLLSNRLLFRGRWWVVVGVTDVSDRDRIVWRALEDGREAARRRVPEIAGALEEGEFPPGWPDDDSRVPPRAS